MRFRFCGGEDCPDWLLAEISSLAAVSVVKVRQLTAEVKGAIIIFLGVDFPWGV